MNPLTLLGGLFHYVFFLPIFNLLLAVYGLIHSFWLAIIVMTLLVRTAMIPLIFKQLQSSKAMQEIGPEIQRIQREFRGEPAVMQQKMSALYKERGVNPYASCLPLLVQLPFIYGLYGALNAILRDSKVTAHSLNEQLYFFVKPIFGPHGLTHLPDTHFLGITLAQIDPTHILPILAALLTFIQLRMSLKRNQSQAVKPANGAPDPNAATMKMMQYIMPFFTLFIGWTFPAGLALYWIVTTAYSIVQQYFFNGRNWGGLFDGITIPGFPKPATALVGNVVEGTTSSPYRNRFARVTEEKATPSTNGNANGRRALPAAREVSPTSNGTKPSNGSKPIAGANGTTANGTTPVSNGTNGVASNGSAPTTRPNPAAPKASNGTRTPTTPLKPNGGKKDAVRLVTPQTNSAANANKATAIPVTRIPKAVNTVTPRPTNGAKSKTSSSAARARKKGR